jgi:RNA polymerase sigma-70 factor (ECF subfamily)
MSQYTLTVLEPINTDHEAPPLRTPAVSADLVLLERFQQGDDAAFVELFDRHNRRLFTYCMKFVGNVEQAQDMTQEFWEKILRLRQRPSTIDNPLAFFLTVARNLCLNHLKARRYHSSLEDIAEMAHPCDRENEMSEKEELILAALDRLPFEQREVLILNIYCGYRFEEIAEMTGKSPEAIWKRASRARKQLREMVMKSHDGEDRP